MGSGGGVVKVSGADSDAQSNPNVAATVNSGAWLVATDIVINANSISNTAAISSNRGGGGIDIGESFADAETRNFLRTINWESTVIMVGADEPELLIDADGAILSAENIVVRERLINGTLSGPLAAGDTFTAGATIVVDDIFFIPGGEATFQANTQSGDVDDNATIRGTDGLFDFRESYETITIKNASDRDLEIGNIQV